MKKAIYLSFKFIVTILLGFALCIASFAQEPPTPVVPGSESPSQGAPSSLSFSQESSEYTRLAAMPFKNITNDPGKDYIGDGLAEAITTELGNVSSIVIVERSQLVTAVKEMQLSQTALVDENEAVQVGKLLSAKYLIIGSYQQSGEEIRVDYRLIDVETGKVNKSDKARGSYGKIFDIQDEIATKTLSWVGTPSQENIQIMAAEPQERNVEVFEYESRYKIAFYEGRMDEAEVWVNKILVIDPNNPFAMMYLGSVMESTGRYDEAMYNYERAAEIYERKKYYKNYSIAQNSMGNVRFNQNQPEEALHHYDRSMEICKLMNNQGCVANTQNSIGNVQYSQHRYDEARQYYEQSLRTRKRIGDQAGVAATLNNIGNVHGAQGRPTEANRFYNESSEIDKRRAQRVFSNPADVKRWENERKRLEQVRIEEERKRKEHPLAAGAHPSPMTPPARQEQQPLTKKQKKMQQRQAKQQQKMQQRQTKQQQKPQQRQQKQPPRQQKPRQQQPPSPQQQPRKQQSQPQRTQPQKPKPSPPPQKKELPKCNGKNGPNCKK